MKAIPAVLTFLIAAAPAVIRARQTDRQFLMSAFIVGSGRFARGSVGGGLSHEPKLAKRLMRSRHHSLCLFHWVLRLRQFENHIFLSEEQRLVKKNRYLCQGCLRPTLPP